MMPTTPTPTLAPCPVTQPFALKRHFRKLKDPRRAHRRLHLLMDIIVIAICAVLCGANTWPEVVTWAQRRQPWLRRFLALPNGIPAHDTFERLFDRLDPVAFQGCFRDWIVAVCEAMHLPHVAIDGKPLRHSGSASLVSRDTSLHAVSGHEPLRIEPLTPDRPEQLEPLAYSS